MDELKKSNDRWGVLSLFKNQNTIVNLNNNNNMITRENHSF
jgi:hypothetical protein